MVVCVERGADLHMAQLMPLTLTVSCFSKIQIGFTFVVPAHLGSPGQRAVKRVCVCVRADQKNDLEHIIWQLFGGDCKFFCVGEFPPKKDGWNKRCVLYILMRSES